MRWPRRSASRPTSGPHATCPTASAPPVSPAAVSEPLVRATRSTLPNWMVAVGSRPRKDTTGSHGPDRPTTSRYVPSVPRPVPALLPLALLPIARR